MRDGKEDAPAWGLWPETRTVGRGRVLAVPQRHEALRAQQAVREHAARIAVAHEKLVGCLQGHVGGIVWLCRSCALRLMGVFTSALCACNDASTSCHWYFRLKGGLINGQWSADSLITDSTWGNLSIDILRNDGLAASMHDN